MLWDGLCREEHPLETYDGQGALWSGPSLRSDWKTPDVRVKTYKVLPELSLLDPFDTIELNCSKNKEAC